MTINVKFDKKFISLALIVMSALAYCLFPVFNLFEFNVTLLNVFNDIKYFNLVLILIPVIACIGIIINVIKEKNPIGNAFIIVGLIFSGIILMGCSIYYMVTLAQNFSEFDVTWVNMLGNMGFGFYLNLILGLLDVSAGIIWGIKS